MSGRYDNTDNTSPIQSALRNTDLSVPRSAFNLSHAHKGQALFGALTPVLCMETLPNQDITVNLASLIELRNPSLRQLSNNVRIYFHAYWCDNSDLWEGFQNFYNHGRNADINLVKPNLIYRASNGVDSRSLVNACTPLSLMDYMGLPAQSFQYSIDGDSFKPLYSFGASLISDSFGGHSWVSRNVGNSPDFVDALPFMAYQRIWRDFYSNKNLLRLNKKWFPDNDDHFILSYNCEYAVCINYEDEDFSSFSSFDDKLKAQFSNIFGLSEGPVPIDVYSTRESSNPVSQTSSSSEPFICPNLAGLKFRQFRGDEFSTASPFSDLIRGDIPSLGDFASESAVNWLSDDGFDLDSKPLYYSLDSDNLTPSYSPAGTSIRYLVLRGSSNADDDGSLNASVRSSVTLNDIRALEVFTVFKERMARTDGDYNDTVEALFGFNPHRPSREPTYIGGFYQDMVFNSVTQTSEGSDESPLGSKSGNGVSSAGGSIGHFVSRNYGWYFVLMSIVPDVYYTQGIHKQFSRRTSNDLWNPLWSNLAPEAIKNKELYVSGNSEVDNDVFGFQDRGYEYRSRSNRVSGLSALSHSVAPYDAASVMSRRFTHTPALNSKFVSMIPENIDMNVLTFNSEPPFDFNIGFSIDSVMPLPRVSVPGAQNIHA